VDGDGHPDLIIVEATCTKVNPTHRRADAGNGLWLRGDGMGGFTPVPQMESGLLAPGDVRPSHKFKPRTERFCWSANNNDSLQVFRVQTNQE
jgi:enediyne biosynthesis protein E4